MRAELVATLLAGASAFGPADPTPSPAATCFDAAADTIAVGRQTARGWVVETSTADGPWLRVMGPVKGRSCPELAAAPDGTAIVAAGSDPARVAMRQPGGGFGAPAVLPGGRTRALATSAAPGGHAAVLWAPRAGRRTALTTLVVGPGQAPVRTVLTRAGTIEYPGLAIAPDGTATAVWNALHPLRKRVSELRGGRWSAPGDLAVSKELTESGVTVALAPNGRRLLAWKADDGVHVRVDDEPAAIVATPEYAEAFAAALADDGSAVLTFVAEDLLVVSRGPGGPWSPPRALPSGDGIPGISFRQNLLGQQIELAPAGQAVITWPLANGRIAAVTGQAGGAWEPAASSLSSPVRFASDPRFSGGRIVWLEPNGFDRAGALRGARRGAPAPVDSTAPRFTARADGRLTARRTGAITVPISVRCSEACDVLGSFTGVEGYAARRLAAGSPATLRVPAYLVPGRGAVRIDVAVADRAGNRTRRSLTVRVSRSTSPAGPPRPPAARPRGSARR